MGQFEEAIDDYSKAIKLDGANVHAIYNRGICYERIREFIKVILLYLVVGY